MTAKFVHKDMGQTVSQFTMTAKKPLLIEEVEKVNGMYEELMLKMGDLETDFKKKENHNKILLAKRKLLESDNYKANLDKINLNLKLKPIKNYEGKLPKPPIGTISEVFEMPSKKVYEYLEFYGIKVNCRTPRRILLREHGIQVSHYIDERRLKAIIHNSQVLLTDSTLMIVCNQDGRDPPMCLGSIEKIEKMSNKSLDRALKFYGIYSPLDRYHKIDLLLGTLGVRLQKATFRELVDSLD